MLPSHLYHLSLYQPDKARYPGARSRLNSTTMLWTMGAVALTACGGGGGGGGQRPSVRKEGIVFDGPVSGARVYLDTDSNGQAGEDDIFIGETDHEGRFSGVVPEEYANTQLYALLDGATDIGDPETDGDEVPVEGIWRAPSGSTVISPLTELLVEAGDEASLLLDELDIPDGTDVTTFNPYSAQIQQSSDRQKVLDASNRVAELITQAGQAQTGLIEQVKTALDDKPVAMSLSAVNLSVDEGVTVARKLSDITFTDDALGVNTAGVNAILVGGQALFEIRNSTELWLKGGVTLDYETAASHVVTVTPHVSGTGQDPDSQFFTLDVTDIAFDIELSAESSTLQENSSTTARKMADMIITGDTTPGVLTGFVSDTRFEVRGDEVSGYSLWLKAGQSFDYEQGNGIGLTVTIQGMSDDEPVVKSATYFVAIENKAEPADQNNDKSEYSLAVGDVADNPRINWIIDDGYVWTDTRGNGVEITYSFIDDQTASGGVYKPDTVHTASDALKAKVRESLALFEQVSLITFVEVADDRKNTLRFGVSEDDDTKVAFAYLPGPGFNAGNVWLNADDEALNKAENLVDGSYHSTTIIHEIGHALGLTHSQDAYGGRSLRLLGHEHNTRSYTIMAYSEAWNDPIDSFISNRTHGPTSLMINDITTLQYIYGTNETWARGDTVYALYGRDVLHETIWDTGGNDTITWEGGETSARIDLNAGSFSSFGDVTGPESSLLGTWGGIEHGSGLVAIALGVSIENATGGQGDDILTGNEVVNKLDGGDGHDIASYRSSPEGVSVSLGGAPDREGFVTGHEGGHAAGDRLIRIEGIEGSSFADTLTGDGGDNTLEGSGGGDVLDGGDGHDIASYRSSPEGVFVSLGGTPDGEGFITGHEGGHAMGDRLIRIEGIEGTPFADTLTGDGGDNTLEGGGDGDVLDGGGGHDIASYRSSPEGVFVSLGGKVDGEGFITGHEGGHAAGDRLRRIEGIEGTPFADTLEGDSGPNTLDGGEGNDHLEGGGGADMIDGGEGFDYARYLGSPAGVTVSLSGPEDGEGYITGHSGGDAEGDWLKNIERLWGSDFGDRLTGDANDNRINGGKGADIIDGGEGDDMAVYWYSDAAVSVDLAGPKDAAGFITGLTGGDAEGDRLKNFEELAGSPFDDFLYGDAWDNVINGGDGADIIDGRGGVDIVSYLFSESGVTIRLDVLDADGFASSNEGGAAVGDRLRNIENIYASDEDDYLVGNDGDNTIWALNGDDYIEGSQGADTLDGGEGDDRASYILSASGVVVGLSVSTTFKITMDDEGYLVGHSNTTPGGDAKGDRLKNIERLTGSGFDDTLLGSDEDNNIRGKNGDDTIHGLGGDDWLVGGAGADWILGGDGVDGASYYDSDEGVSVSLEVKDGALFSTGHTGGHAEGDQLQHIEKLEGSPHADNLTGDNEDNALLGRAGNDVLKGLGGDDVLAGNEGADIIDGGDGDDDADYYLSSEGVIIDLGGKTDKDGYITGHSGGYAEGDRLKGIENIYGSKLGDNITGDDGENTIVGRAGDDTLSGGGDDDRIYGNDGDDIIRGGTNEDRLFGGDGDDTIYGGSNDDVIFGGAGNDTLIGDGGHDHLYGDEGRNVYTGGAGADQFALTSLASTVSGADVITDFSLSDKDGLSILAEIRSIWVDQSSSVTTGETTNDIHTRDTVIYTDQLRTEIIAVLEDFTGALDNSIGDTTLSLNTFA